MGPMPRALINLPAREQCPVSTFPVAVPEEAKSRPAWDNCVVHGSLGGVGHRRMTSIPALRSRGQGG